MYEIIQKINDENQMFSAFEKYKIMNQKPLDFELDTNNLEEIKKFFEYYIPEVFALSDDEYIKFLLELDDYLVEIFLSFKSVSIDKQTALTLLSTSNYLVDIILKQNPDLVDEDFVEFILADGKKFPNILYNYLNYDYVVDGLIKKNESLDRFINSNLGKTLENLDLSDSAKYKIFKTLNFGDSDIPNKFLNDEIVVKALLESQHSLPYNANEIPISILERYHDLVIKYIRENFTYYHETDVKFVTNAFKSKILVEEYIKSGVINYHVFSLIPESNLLVLEQNMDVVEQNMGHSSSYLINGTTKKSKVFFEKFWKGNLEKFDSTLVVQETEFLLVNGFDFSQIGGNSKIIFQESQFIKKAIMFQAKNNLEISAIRYAEGEAFEQNIIYAIELGFDYKKHASRMQDKLFKSDTFIQYLINKKDLDTLITYLKTEEVIKYEDDLVKIVTIRDDGFYYDFLSSAVITKKLLIESNYNFNFLKHVRLYDVKDLSKWVSLVEEVYDRGFRIEKPEDCYGIINTKILVYTYMKKSKDYTIIDKVNFFNEDITDLVELAISLGYILNEHSYNAALATNDVVIKNTLLYGNPLFFDRIQKELSKEDTELAYSRGYRITASSSIYFLKNLYAFEKEFELGNFKAIYLLRTEASDKLIQMYFDNGFIIDASTSPFIRTNPLAIHLMFEKTNDISTIDLALSKVYREDFIKAIDLGYVITDKTPVGIINNSMLMGCYLEKKLNVFSNLKDFVMSLSKSDKLGINGAAASFDLILSNEEITSCFSDVEIVKLVKYIYFSADTKVQLCDIITNGNIKLLKQIYDICLSINYSPNFDVVMFKNIVMNFNNNYELCKIFVNSDYLPKDIQLLYHFVVNGTINNNEVIDLESLRNYKQTVYEKNCNLINNENVYGHELLEQIFKLLCNKTYNEIDILINQLFSVDRIDELLLTVHNEDMREELKNYRVFMELSESIRSIWGIDSLKNILMALNEKFISNSRDLEIIWSTFKNITEIAKRFYGEEIKEKITDFSILGDMDSTAVVHGIEECDETSKVILRKARYSTGEYSYQEVQYTSKDVDLIELNGIPFVSFAHVLNAYGSGATLSDFKNPRLIGRTYICLSAIDDEKFGTVSRDVIDMDHVTLLFSSFNSEQLALASNRDIGSYGADNNLALTGGSNNFRPVRSVISNTYDGENGYNEYVMYREDGNGNIIYPSAVLVTGSEPNEFEIRAASYLGVPLVRINKSKYLNAVGYEITPNDIIPSDFLNKKVKWVSLKRSIEQIYDNILGSGSETKLVDDGAKKI